MENEIIGAINEHIQPAMLGAVVALWVIGYVLKETPSVANWAIYWIVMALGVVAGLVIVGLNADGVIQGILAGALAITGHQGFKQTAKAVNETTGK